LSSHLKSPSDISSVLIAAAVATVCYTGIQLLAYWVNQHNFDTKIFDLAFGFGASTEHLVRTGTFKIPFSPANDLLYASAARMPVLPLMLALLHQMSDSVLIALIIKNLLLNSIMFGAMAYFIKTNQFRLQALCPVLWALLTPQTLLHSAALDYEEGFLVQLLAASLALFLCAKPSGGLHLKNNGLWFSIAALTAVQYLCKSNLALCAAWNLMFGAFLSRSVKVAIILTVPTALAASTWGFVNYSNTGVFNVGSSLAGFYCWKANNDWSYAHYPMETLDKVPYGPPFGDLRIEINNFSGEWERDAHMMSLGKRWIWEHSDKWAELVLRRFWVLFGEVRNTPGDGASINPSGLIQWVGVLFMFGNRIIELAAFCLTVFLLSTQRSVQSLRYASIYFYGWVLAYVLPFLIGFAYERHVIPLLVPTALYLILLLKYKDSSRALDSRTAEASEPGI